MRSQTAVLVKIRFADGSDGLGKRSVREDIDHVARIKRAVGDAASVRVDVKLAWSLTEERWGDGVDVSLDPNKVTFHRRGMFTDEELFGLEMKHIYEGNWIYVARESQIPEPGDYLTFHMGRTPVVIIRDKGGELHALVNSCSHRGAMLCRFKRCNQ